MMGIQQVDLLINKQNSEIKKRRWGNSGHAAAAQFKCHDKIQTMMLKKGVKRASYKV